QLFKKFSPYSSLLNIDEVEDINKAWEEVGKKMGMKGKELKEKIMPMTAIYSIAEHSRALLVALNDGGLPSNVGGGYNLRVILRRALGFIDQFGWDLKLKEVAGWHAEELKELFPELKQNLAEVAKILDVETEKYKASKEKAAQIVARVIDKDVTDDMLVELYDSHGISPEMVRDEAKKSGKMIIIPDDFYKKLGERHEQKEKKLATHRETTLDLEGVPDTEVMYWGSHDKLDFEAKVLKVDGEYVIIDKTAFYPTSGGQMHDVGEMNGKHVEDVFKQGAVIVHKVPGHGLKKGDNVKGRIEKERREQLAKHHTATHIVNGAARKVLGRHVWQAGAAKTLEKSRLDITHYDSLSKEEMEKIEEEANKIVKKGVKINKRLIPRREAEDKYGFALYQGGAVPGKMIRVVEIEGWDVEACGGTHLDNTSEVGEIKLIKSSKLQDGIVRLEFVAGKAVEKIERQEEGNLAEVAEFLGVDERQVPGRAKELFDKWKTAVKKKKRLDSYELTSTEEYPGEPGEILVKTAEILKTQPATVLNTLQRFRKELDEAKEK
ncbi:TPA: alanine--tRNA ligase, partial [Candidatus Woesearchaeota archaeon]|nr:alanine--tRNA ligase [Candidatus Woesearchaeota archaeon]